MASAVAVGGVFLSVVVPRWTYRRGCVLENFISGTPLGYSVPEKQEI